ncbi:MAG: exo-beta-N-acetylmuramidase NamZ family protein [Candidatus Kryptoniota bacterium]
MVGSSEKAKTKLGSQSLIDSNLNLLEGKRVGIVTNHTSIFPDGGHIVDELLHQDGIIIKALFSPEHGIRGNAPAGKKISDDVDPVTGIQVFSLYGEHRKPTDDMLEGIDILLYDIQDVGARFYTYISTLTLVMEAAAEKSIPFILNDRPLVISGNIIDGPVLKESVKSFVGMLPVPILYSLTPGELSRFIRDEHLMRTGLEIDLHIIKLQNYNRNLWYDETGLPWLPPSPNIPTINTAIMYPGTALVEGTNISEGRGTGLPFLQIGAPFIDKNDLADFLNNLNLPGVKFKPVSFIPGEAVTVTNPKYKDQQCNGVEIVIVERELVKPVEVGIAIICAIRKLYPDYLMFRADGAFDRLVGDKAITSMIMDGAGYADVIASWRDELSCFDRYRERFFLY